MVLGKGGPAREVVSSRARRPRNPGEPVQGKTERQGEGEDRVGAGTTQVGDHLKKT